MKEINLTIDGKKVSIPPGTTILEAAAEIGIEIPSLCYHAELKPSGNCRVCVVELEGSRALVGSCHTPVEEGMVVKTSSNRVMEARKTIIELMLAGHTGTCLTDINARECGLHKMASDLEISPPRFHVKHPRFYPAEEKNPYVIRDMSKCILCRKCIRACTEIAGKDVYSMAYRGFMSKVVVDCDMSLNKEVCRDCGICIEYCPTNALSLPEGVRKKEGKEKNKNENENAKPAIDQGKRSELLNMFESKQRAEGNISKEAIVEIAKKTGLSVSDVYGVASFYSFLSIKPKGRYNIRVCKSMSCYLRNSDMIIEAIVNAIGIRPGETSPDGEFSFELTNCIGACDQAPAMLINDTLFSNLTPEKTTDILNSHKTK